jgi:hypothetical protein
LRPVRLDERLAIMLPNWTGRNRYCGLRGPPSCSHHFELPLFPNVFTDLPGLTVGQLFFGGSTFLRWSDLRENFCHPVVVSRVVGARGEGF